jgi:ribosomal protein S18 acetylase RimI-like enzyme
VDVRVEVRADLERRAARLRAFYPRLAAARFDSRLLSATIDGTVVGTALSGPPHDNFGPWVGELYRLHVHPDHRGRGVGTRLHEACVAAWRATGITVGVLEVRSHDAEALAFYESHGWLPDAHTREARDGSYVRLRRAIT